MIIIFFDLNIFSLFFRPMSQSGRPVSGFVRPGMQSGPAGSMEQAIKTPRTAHTARPVTSASGRFVRLGTVCIRSYSFILKLSSILELNLCQCLIYNGLQVHTRTCPYLEGGRHRKTLHQWSFMDNVNVNSCRLSVQYKMYGNLKFDFKYHSHIHILLAYCTS